MKEIIAYAQEDLLNDDVYILDSFDKVYIWIGNRSNKFEKAGAYKKAEEYIAGVQDGRAKDEVIIDEVDAGHEPEDFCQQFIQWEPEVAKAWLDADPMAALRKEFEAQEAMKVAEESKDQFEGFLNPKDKTFTYEEIKGKFPEGIKGNAKEWYLSDAEFEQHIGMTKDAFKDIKGWKQQDIKKKLGIF